MTRRRQRFIVVVAVLAVCWAGTSGEGAAPPQRCKSGNARQEFPATGQTTTAPRPPYHAGDDGDIQAGATLSYTDNGDGTITDNNTCLTWEKKSSDGTVHDWLKGYTWDDAFDVHVATLNATNFAGHNDWRVPNVNELESIVNYGMLEPSVSPEFNNACLPGCTVLTCSCTLIFPGYWTSTSRARNPSEAWVVDFITIGVGSTPKNNASFSSPVRAVRGGSNLGSAQ